MKDSKELQGKKSINMQIESNLWYKVGVKAAKDQTSRRSIVETALKQYLNLK